jgi:hypothetical protein
MDHGSHQRGVDGSDLADATVKDPVCDMTVMPGSTPVPYRADFTSLAMRSRSATRDDSSPGWSSSEMAPEVIT